MKRAPNMRVVTAITIVACVGGVGACFYQYSALNDAQARVDSVQKKAKSEKTLQAQAVRTANQLKECTDRLAHLEQSIPEVAYVPTLLKDLETVGRANGLEVLGVRPVPKTDKKDDKSKSSDSKKPYQELKIEIKCRGNYHAVLGFVKALKNFPKIVAARAITLAPKSEANTTTVSRLDATIELKTYAFPPADGPKTASSGKEVTNKNG